MSRRNQGLAFPESNGRLVFADLREEPETEKNEAISLFKIASRAQLLPDGAPTERAIASYAQDPRGPCPQALRDHFARHRYELIVSTTEAIEGSSHGLVSLLAVLLSYRRRALMTEDGAQKAILLAATGVIQANGAVKAVDHLTEKLAALIADDDDVTESRTYQQRIFVMPAQTLSAAETALVENVQAAGWTVLQIGNVADPVLEAIWGAAQPAPDPESEPAETTKRQRPARSWRTPVMAATGICAIAGFALFYPIEDGSGTYATQRPAAQQDDPSHGFAVPRYSGTLTVDLVPVADGKRTLAVAAGHLFLPGDQVDLDIRHSGPDRAVAVLFRNGGPTDRLVLEAGQTTTIRRRVEDLTGQDGAMTLRAANCATDCDAELAAMVVPAPGITIPDAQKTHAGDVRLTGNGTAELWASVALSIASGSATSTLHLAPRAETPIDKQTRTGFAQDIVDAVGLLNVKLVNSRSVVCTASLVAPDIILAPAFCVNTSGPERALEISFVIGFDHGTSASQRQSVDADLTPLERDARLGYVLLRLRTAINGIKPLELNAKNPTAGENLLLVGHPLAKEKTVILDGCSALDPATDKGQLLHSCTTDNGSAGSIIASQTSPPSLIAMHQTDGPRAKSGVLLSILLQESKILANLAAAQ